MTQLPLTQTLGRELGLDLVACTPLEDSHHQHFRGGCGRRQGAPVFVKVVGEIGYWQRAIRAAALPETVAAATPRLLSHGDHIGHDGQRSWWLAYEWVDLTPFRPSPERLEQAGQLLGRLHHASSGIHAADHFQRHDLDEEITARTADLGVLDPATAHRVRHIRHHWGPVEMPDDAVVVHGDVQWRNFGLRGNGSLMWFDWDNTAIGPALLDFGKLVDHALAAPHDRAAFLRGYHRHAPPVYPWPRSLRWVRLWSTLGLLTYALRRHHVTFTRHAHHILNQLSRHTNSRDP